MTINFHLSLNVRVNSFPVMSRPMTSDPAKGRFSCGVDEAGRGPVIGPLVVSVVCANDEDMRRIGARDSKTLTPGSRRRLFDLIVENTSFHFIKKIDASKLNDLMSRINLNQIEEEAYAEVISKAPFQCSFFVDSFDVDPARLSRKLSQMTGKEVVCEHKADSLFPTVSAASILSKVTRDNEIEELEKKYGTIGSGYPSDPVTVDFLKRSVENGVDLSDIARTHWKTYRNLISSGKNRKLF